MPLAVRTLLLLAALASPVVGLHAQQRIDIRRPVAPDVAVRISGSYAKLEIIAWQHDSLALTGTLPKGARLDGGVAAVGVPRGAKFWIEPGPNGPGGEQLVLRVPARARVWVKTEQADVSADGVTGELDLNIVAGRLAVRGHPRHANLESMDGAVTVDGSANWLRIKTADGDVTVRGSSEDMAITTISGEVAVRDGAFDRARVQSVTGGVSFSGTLVRGAELSVDTHSGAIDFTSSRTASLAIDARSLTGRIDNTLFPKRPIQGRSGRGEELAAQLGAGSALVELRSFKAGIRLAVK